MNEDKLEGKNILLIVSDDFLAHLIETKFTALGARINRKTTGADALQAFAEVKPDLTIVDTHLTDFEGSTFFEELAANRLPELYPTLAIIDPKHYVTPKTLVDSGISEYIQKDDITAEVILDRALLVLRKHEIKAATAPLGTVESKQASEAKTGAIKILVVEDDPMLRNVLSMKFSKGNIEATFTNDGTQALDLIEQMSSDLVILDLMLPGKDGFEILSDIRASEKFKELPVIIFSNKSEPADRDRVMQLGANHYFIKAMTDLGELMNKIKELVEKQ